MEERVHVRFLSLSTYGVCADVSVILHGISNEISTSLQSVPAPPPPTAPMISVGEEKRPGGGKMERATSFLPFVKSTAEIRTVVCVCE